MHDGLTKYIVLQKANVPFSLYTNETNRKVYILYEDKKTWTVVENNESTLNYFPRERSHRSHV